MTTTNNMIGDNNFKLTVSRLVKSQKKTFEIHDKQIKKLKSIILALIVFILGVSVVYIVKINKLEYKNKLLNIKLTEQKLIRNRDLVLYSKKTRYLEIKLDECTVLKREYKQWLKDLKNK